MLRLQDRERIFACSCLERETFQHTLDQTCVRDHISTRSQGSLFHPHPDQALSLRQPRPPHYEMHVGGGSGPQPSQSNSWQRPGEKPLVSLEVCENSNHHCTYRCFCHTER